LLSFFTTHSKRSRRWHWTRETLGGPTISGTSEIYFNRIETRLDFFSERKRITRISCY